MKITEEVANRSKQTNTSKWSSSTLICIPYLTTDNSFRASNSTSRASESPSKFSRTLIYGELYLHPSFLICQKAPLNSTCSWGCSLFTPSHLRLQKRKWLASWGHHFHKTNPHFQGTIWAIIIPCTKPTRIHMIWNHMRPFFLPH